MCTRNFIRSRPYLLA